MRTCQLRPPREYKNYKLRRFLCQDFKKKNKKLFELDVEISDNVWDPNSIKKGKPAFRKDIEIFGRVEKGTSAFIKSTNKHGKNFKFVEDTSNLPKNAKNKIVDLFDNHNKKVVYLVKKK